MFIAALFTIGKTWKQPQCSWRDKQIKKMWHVPPPTHTHTYTLEYYSVIKNNEIMPFTATWMDPEIILLGEVNQTKKDRYQMI